MGFLKFVLGVVMVIIGGLGCIWAGFMLITGTMMSDVGFMSDFSSTPSIVIGGIFFVVLLGGIYIVRKH